LNTYLTQGVPPLIRRRTVPASMTNGGESMATRNIKQEAIKLVENLPEDATWDDLMYEIYVRQAIEAGLEDIKAGRTVDIQEVRAKFGLSK
jgi:hypothetical protein